MKIYVILYIMFLLLIPTIYADTLIEQNIDGLNVASVEYGQAGGTVRELAQNFTVNTTSDLYRIEIYGKEVGNPDDTYSFGIETCTSGGQPSGSLIDSNAQISGDFSTDFGAVGNWANFTLNSTSTLTAGTCYSLVMRNNEGTNNQYYFIGWDSPGDYPPGRAWRQTDGGGWAEDLSTADYNWRLWDSDVDSTPPSIAVLFPNSTYNDTYNYDMYINISIDETGNCSLNDTSFFNYTSNNTFYSFNETALSDGFYVINATCEDSSNNLNSTLIFFTKDVSNPVVSSETPYDWDDYATLFYDFNDGIIGFNYTFTDNIDLYSFRWNITNGTATKTLQRNDSTSLSGTSQDYNFQVNTWNMTNNSYFNYSYELCDSHTAKNLKKADNVFIDKGIINFTFGSTIISLETIYSNTIIEAEKLKDRYVLNTYGRINEKNIFMLKSNKPINYRMESPIKGHFIIGKYWVDFEPYDNIVYPIDDYYYQIEIKGNDIDLSLNSIGKLNCIYSTQEFSLNQTVPTNATTFNYNASALLGSTGWFNFAVINLNTTAGVLVLFFLFFILVCLVVFSEYVRVAVITAIVGIYGLFLSFVLYVSLSAILGILMIGLSVMYMLRSIAISKE
jgi:hypothetical protein